MAVSFCTALPDVTGGAHAPMNKQHAIQSQTSCPAPASPRTSRTPATPTRSIFEPTGAFSQSRTPLSQSTTPPALPTTSLPRTATLPFSPARNVFSPRTPALSYIDAHLIGGVYGGLPGASGGAAALRNKHSELNERNKHSELHERNKHLELHEHAQQNLLFQRLLSLEALTRQLLRQGK